MSLFTDENIYLSDKASFLRILMKLNYNKYQKIVDYENEIYSSLINLYNLYISKASELVNEIGIKNNSISIMRVIKALVLSGAFSYNCKFEKKSGADDILISKNGLNVIDGVGCCRHVTAFSKDIMGNENEFPCVLSTIDNKDLSYKRELNHIMNLIYYKGVPYGFDVYNNGTLYKLINEFEMMSFDEELGLHIHYKPYYDIIFNSKNLSDIKQILEFYKQVCGKCISKEELNQIIYLTDIRLLQGLGLIADFKSDTYKVTEEIKRQICDIKGDYYGK